MKQQKLFNTEKYHIRKKVCNKIKSQCKDNNKDLVLPNYVKTFSIKHLI